MREFTPFAGHATVTPELSELSVATCAWVAGGGVRGVTVRTGQVRGVRRCTAPSAGERVASRAKTGTCPPSGGPSDSPAARDHASGHRAIHSGGVGRA